MAAAYTRTKKVRNLTPEEYKACYSLNMRCQGLMRRKLKAFMHGDNQAYASLHYNADGVLIGWALTFRDQYGNLSTYFYVRKNHRRKGIGKLLMTHVNKKFGQVRVYPWGESANPSRQFFNFVHQNKLNIQT